MPGAGHLANLEQPVGFNRVLEQFLREIAHG
jgi:pimeloyl-ACP methyl ester carboxylesterase